MHVYIDGFKRNTCNIKMIFIVIRNRSFRFTFSVKLLCRKAEIIVLKACVAIEFVQFLNFILFSLGESFVILEATPTYFMVK